MTTTPTAVEYDMFDRDIYASPYPVYRRLRDEAPLYYNAEHDFYAVSRFDDVARVLTDRETFISGKGGVYTILTRAYGDASSGYAVVTVYRNSYAVLVY